MYEIKTRYETVPNEQQCLLSNTVNRKVSYLLPRQSLCRERAVYPTGQETPLNHMDELPCPWTGRKCSWRDSRGSGRFQKSINEIQEESIFSSSFGLCGTANSKLTPNDLNFWRFVVSAQVLFQAHILLAGFLNARRVFSGKERIVISDQQTLGDVWSWRIK